MARNLEGARLAVLRLREAGVTAAYPSRVSAGGDMGHHNDKRAKFRGRRSGHTFLRLPHFVVKSPQWRALSGKEVKFLVELASHYDGRNNGDLALTRGQAIERGWRSGETRDRAAEEACEAGCALLTRRGHKGACNLYAITWEPINDVGKGVAYVAERKASRLWEKRDPLARNWRELAQKLGKAA
jgi:hypothetical protein